MNKIALISLILAACTGGKVHRGGVPLSGARIEVVTPDFRAETIANASGEFSFNPYRANAPDFDWTKYIPEGDNTAFAVTTTDAQRFIFVVSHHYTSRCSIPWNNVYAQRDCKLYDFNVDKPRELSEADALALQDYVDRRRAFDKTIANIMSQLNSAEATIVGRLK